MNENGLQDWRTRVVPLLEPEEQRTLVDEIVGRLQVKLADRLRLADPQPGRVSAWRVIFDAEWQAKTAVDALFRDLHEELVLLGGKSPARTPLACPSAGCDGYLVVGVGELPTGEPTYLEGFRAAVECDEIAVGVCTECGSDFAPAEYRELTEATAPE